MGESSGAAAERNSCPCRMDGFPAWLSLSKHAIACLLRFGSQSAVCPLLQERCAAVKPPATTGCLAWPTGRPSALPLPCCSALWPPAPRAARASARQPPPASPHWLRGSPVCPGMTQSLTRSGRLCLPSEPSWRAPALSQTGAPALAAGQASPATAAPPTAADASSRCAFALRGAALGAWVRPPACSSLACLLACVCSPFLSTNHAHPDPPGRPRQRSGWVESPAAHANYVHAPSSSRARRSLAGLGLAGPLNWDAIANLTALQSLYLGQNGLRGMLVPPASLPRTLRDLELTENRIAGTLHADWSPLANLECLDL